MRKFGKIWKGIDIEPADTPINPMWARPCNYCGCCGGCCCFAAISGCK
ncbi:MAG: hypothetical protein HXS46_09130 [Theionarchaea archaeon]|nr:hypothetical protein [Theionarchaea archaeon]